MKSYRVITENQQRLFEESVTRAINDGWELVGGGYSVDSNESCYFCQSIIKDGNGKGNSLIEKRISSLKSLLNAAVINLKDAQIPPIEVNRERLLLQKKKDYELKIELLEWVMEED